MTITSLGDWRRYRPLVVTALVLLALVASSRSALHAQAAPSGNAGVSTATFDHHFALAGPTRPSNVPANYLITPFGYLHPSCVHEVREGEQVLHDGRIRHADQSVDAEAPSACAHSRYKADGTQVDAEGHALAEKATAGLGGAAQRPPTINGYVELATATTSSSYGKLNGTWTVPTAPGKVDGQVVYFFTGMEDLQNTQSILQPVLQWSSSQWAIAGWNCCITGQAYHSAFVDVRQGDSIFGSIVSTCPPGTLTCDTWNVTATDQTLRQTTSLTSNTRNQTFNWAFGGALEAYGINQCSDFPTSGNLSYTHLALYNNAFSQITPEWSASNASSSISPKCDYNVSTNASQVNVGFQQIPPSSPISGSHVLVSQNATGLALDDQYSKTASGSPVDIWRMNGTGAQRWLLSTSDVVPGGFYNIAVSYGAYCLTGSATQGTQVELQPCDGSLAQAWSATQYGDSYSFHPALNTAFCLDVRFSGTTSGTPVQVWGCDNTPAQEWVVR